MSDSRFGELIGPGTFRIERRLPGPIERIWSYLTVAEKRRQWFADGPMDLIPGGAVDLSFRFDDLSPETSPPDVSGQCHVPGRITVCDPPHLLAFTWGTGPDASEVTFELTSQGDDVLLVITHRRLPPLQIVTVASGWHVHLDLLGDSLSGGGPRLFWTHKRQLEADYHARLFASNRAAESGFSHTAEKERLS